MKSKTTQRILSNHVLRSESLKPNKAIRLLALDFLFDDVSSALDRVRPLTAIFAPSDARA